MDIAAFSIDRGVRLQRNSHSLLLFPLSESTHVLAGLVFGTIAIIDSGVWELLRQAVVQAHGLRHPEVDGGRFSLTALTGC